jgi:hypothetical protein
MFPTSTGAAPLRKENIILRNARISSTITGHKDGCGVGISLLENGDRPGKWGQGQRVRTKHIPGHVIIEDNAPATIHFISAHNNQHEHSPKPRAVWEICLMLWLAAIYSAHSSFVPIRRAGTASPAWACWAAIPLAGGFQTSPATRSATGADPGKLFAG